MKPLTLPTVFGGQVRLKTGVDAFASRYGALLEFLDEDGTIRDFDGLERVDAAMLGLALCDLAQDGLSVDEAQALMEEALARLASTANVIPFPASAARFAFCPPVEDPADADTATSASAGIVEPLAPRNNATETPAL